MKQRLSILLVICMMFSYTSVFASEAMQKKNEIVYVNLDEYGKPELINVYNSYILQDASSVIDYAKYSKLTNLTNHAEPSNDEGKILWDVSGLNKFSYMGVVDNELSVNIPWNIKLSYKLNGEDKKPEELVGKSGLVKVIIEISENENAKEYFRNNYMLEITSSYDMSDYISVTAKDATEVLTGNTKTLMFIALPGQEKTFEIELGTDNFTMEGLTFAMIPLQGDILDKVSDISDDKDELDKSIESLNKSMDVLLNNTSSMSSGVAKLTTGNNDLKNASNKLHSLAESRNQNITDLSNDLNELSRITNNAITDVENLEEAVNDLNEMVSQINEITPELITSLDDLIESLDNFEKDVESLPSDLKDVKKLVKDTKETLISTKALLRVKIESGNVDTETIEECLQNIKEASMEIYSVSEEPEVKQNAGMILNNLSKVSDQLSKLEKMSKTATAATENLFSNIGKVTNDMTVLEDNISSLSKDAEDLPDAVSAMKKSVYSINEILKLVDEKTKKYVENQNDTVNAVNDLKELTIELEQINKHLINVLNNVKSMTTILDNEIYSGVSNITQGLEDVLKNTQKMIAESNNIKNSKNTIYDVTKNRVDEVTEETNIFNIDKNAKVESFTSSENEAPEMVQILLKTKSITKENFEDTKDLEPEKEHKTLWQKIVELFNIVSEWFKKLFA